MSSVISNMNTKGTIKLRILEHYFLNKAVHGAYSSQNRMIELYGRETDYYEHERSLY